MTHREWLERQGLKFKIGGRKENTLVWNTNDLKYRPARGDTGLSVEPKHLRGNVFPSLYKALQVDVERINARCLAAVPQAGTRTAVWERAMRLLCRRRQWLRQFIEKGGLSTVVTERDIAEVIVASAVGRRRLEAQAQSDAQQVAMIGAAIRRGAYTLKPERLLGDVMEIVRNDVSRQAARQQVLPEPKEITRKDRETLERVLTNPNT